MLSVNIGCCCHKISKPKCVKTAVCFCRPKPARKKPVRRRRTGRCVKRTRHPRCSRISCQTPTIICDCYCDD